MVEQAMLECPVLVAGKGDDGQLSLLPDDATSSRGEKRTAVPIPVVMTITDATGARVAHFKYDALGTLLPTSDFGPLEGWSSLLVGSPGVRWDAATGLYYMRQRWYEPGSERFVSRDRIRDMNRYACAYDSPLNLVDPDGSQPPVLEPPPTSPPPGPATPTLVLTGLLIWLLSERMGSNELPQGAHHRAT